MRGIYDAAFDGVGTGLVYGAAAVIPYEFVFLIKGVSLALDEKNMLY